MQKDLQDKIAHVGEEPKNTDSRLFFALNGVLEKWEICPWKSLKSPSTFSSKKGYMNPEKFTSSLTFIIWLSCAQSLTNTQSMWNPRTLPFWCSDFWHIFDTRNGFSGSGPGTEWIDAFKKMLSPLCSCPFLLVCYFTASLFFLLVCTDQEPGTS